MTFLCKAMLMTVNFMQQCVKGSKRQTDHKIKLSGTYFKPTVQKPHLIH